MVKLADIAKDLGLSLSVVSRALSDQPDKHAFIKKSTADRIRSYARSVGYQPNRQASFLGKGKCATIFCFLPDTPTRLINDLMFGIAETACGENFPVNFFLGRNSVDFDKFLLHSKQNDHSGLITLPPGKMSERVFESFCEYHSQGGKVLFLNTISNTPPGRDFEAFREVPCLNIDEFYGGQLAAAHLLECQCDEFFVVTDQETIFQTREQGFVEFLAAKGIPVHSVGIERLKTLTLKTGKRPGFFSDSDYMALNLYPIFAERKLKIGEKVLICGFDDIFYSRVSIPSLTTIHQPTRMEGKIAVQKLVSMIYGEQAKDELLKPFLVKRESTGGTRPDPEYPEREKTITDLQQFDVPTKKQEV